jgi:hypothetical protein
VRWPDGADGSAGFTCGPVRRTRPEPGLRDLRDLHLAAAQNSLYWEMLAQAAQATRDDGLLDLSSACHPQTLRQMRWTNTMIKIVSPQVLSSL